MSDTVISVEKLGKAYLVGHQAGRERYVALRDVLARGARNIARKTADLLHGRQIVQGDEVEEFWALKDVNFEVKQGEVVGIIGRNGAGKSTLLKILSRITEPTEGRICLRGRIGSLLEVGTGFHPELSGRENIFLNGAILGMTRKEVASKFDEIVAFAEVDKFIDTPVKRFSSGMYVRLAFAVAAHLESEIIVVDEVLAVGDAEFQKRCLGKMGEVARGGRTVLFVSHNMNAIERLCQRVLWLHRGQLAGPYSDTRSGILAYLKRDNADGPGCVWRQSDGYKKNDHFSPHEFRISSTDARAPDGPPFSNQYDIVVDIAGQVLTPDPALNVGIALYNEEGVLVFWSFTTDVEEENWVKLERGPVHLRVIIPRRLLNEGTYRLELLATLHYRVWLFEPGRTAPMASFAIQGGLSDSPYWDIRRPGMMAPVLHWQCQQSAARRTLFRQQG